MPWTCEQTEERLLDAMEGALDAARQAEMDRHLAECTRCTRLIEGVHQTVGMLHGLEQVKPDPWLEAKIISRTMPSQTREPRRASWLYFALHPRFLLGALAVLITFTVVFGTLSNVAPVSASPANPVQVYRQVDRFAHLAYARGVKFLSDLRVVYEIQSRFEKPADNPSVTLRKNNTYQMERHQGRWRECRLRIARHPHFWRRA